MVHTERPAVERSIFRATPAFVKKSRTSNEICLLRPAFALTAAVAGVVALLVLCTILLGLLLWKYQERVVFQPSPPPYPEDSSAQRLTFRADDGQDLLAYIVEPAASPRGTLVAFHGNADLAIWRLGWARRAAVETGWRIVLAEYRGYGGLAGTPSASGVRRDARAAIAAARSLPNGATMPLAIYGHSLGSAVAAEAAADAKPAALVLESPFTSATEMARRVVGGALVPVWRVVSRVPYDTRHAVSQLDAPVWVVHGERDTVIPSSMGEAVFAAAKRRGELLLLRNAGHNDVSDTGGREYWTWLARSLELGR